MIHIVGFGVGLAVCTLLDDQYKSRKGGVIYDAISRSWFSSCMC